MSEPRTTYGGETAEAAAREQIIAEALAPAYVATSSDTARVKPAVDWLIAEARLSLDPSVIAAVAPQIEHLRELASQIDAGENDNAIAELAEGAYLMRGLIADTERALALLQTRRYLQSIDVPETLPDLRLDRAVAAEQLSFAALVREPQRLPAILAAVEHFRRQYRKAYVRHHEMYWQTMSGIESHLLEAQTRAAALARLNSLAELGPPVGEMALESIASLAEETSGCALTVADAVRAQHAVPLQHLSEALAESPVCPACGIRLDQGPPLAQAEEALSRLDRSIERQLARLSSVAVRETLERSNDPRIERFLRVVQAAQLSTLAEVLDDALTNYLRRFLIEARINAVLDPLLAQVERGETPDESAVREKLAEVTDLIERAQQASHRSLPPGEEKKKR
jgi:hypothetical protein